jgi:hypothetical protein
MLCILLIAFLSLLACSLACITHLPHMFCFISLLVACFLQQHTEKSALCTFPKLQVEITIGISSGFANINTAFFDGGIGNLDTIVRHPSIFCTSWNHYSFDSKNNRCLCLSSKHMQFVIIIRLLFSDSFFCFLMNVLAH